MSTVLLATLTITLLIIRPFTEGSAEPAEEEPEIPLVFNEKEQEHFGQYNVLSDATPVLDDGLTVAELMQEGDTLTITCLSLDLPSAERLVPSERLFFGSAPDSEGGEIHDDTIHLEFDVSSVSLEETVVVDRLAARVIDFEADFNTRVARYSCRRGGGAAAAIVPRRYEGQLDPERETELSPVDADAPAGYILEPDQVLSLEADLQPIKEGRYSFRLVVYYHTSGGREGSLLSPTTHQITYVERLSEAELYPFRPPAEG